MEDCKPNGNMSSRKEKFDTVVLSGGGVKGIAQLGNLHYFYDIKEFDPEYVKTYAGTSIGSIICLLLLCGYLPMEIFQEVYSMDSLFGVNKDNVWDFFKKFGLMSIKTLIDKIETLVIKKKGKIPTLLQLHKETGKMFIVAVTNVTKMKAECFSAKTHPHLKVTDAVSMSSNLPLICHRLRYQGCYYIDGGLTNHFLIGKVIGHARRLLGIMVTGSDIHMDKKDDDGFFDYLHRLIVIPINMITELQCPEVDEPHVLVKMRLDGVPLMGFSMTKDEKMKLFLLGYTEAEQIWKRQPLIVKGWIWNNPREEEKITEIHDIPPPGNGWDLDVEWEDIPT